MLDYKGNKFSTFWPDCIAISAYIDDDRPHAGHTHKASRISKAAEDNCCKGVGNLYLSYQTILVRYMHLCIISNVSRL